MNEHLVKIEQQALAAKNAGNWQKAAALFAQLVCEEPSWEHGYGFLSLAECYEELGSYNDARMAYQRAFQIGRDDPNILGGVASFLYLHGDAREAFEAYLQLLQMESAQANTTAAESIKDALRTLAGRLDMSNDSLDAQIASAEVSRRTTL